MTTQEIFNKEKARVDALVGVDSCAHNRKRETIVGRSVLAYVLHKKRKLSTTVTGKLMGIDHGTVLFHCKKAKDTLKFPKSDPTLFHYLAQVAPKRALPKINE